MTGPRCNNLRYAAAFPLPRTCEQCGLGPCNEPELSIAEKVDYVRAQPQTREHTCHWPGCKKQVPPAMWGCITHWRKLPQWLRNKVWDAYVVGQEVTMTPSDKYLAVMVEVDAWIKLNHKGN